MATGSHADHVHRRRQHARQLRQEQQRVGETMHLARSLTLQGAGKDGNGTHEDSDNFLAQSEIRMSELHLQELSGRGHGADAVVESNPVTVHARNTDESPLRHLHRSLETATQELRKKHADKKAAHAKLLHLQEEHAASDPSRDPRAHAARAEEIERLRAEVYADPEHDAGQHAP